MSDSKSPTPNRRDTPASVDRETIARLLRLAGPRPSVPQEAEERVRAATHEAWRQSIRATRRRRYLYAAAATLAATLAAALVWSPSRQAATVTPAPVEVATLRSATGTIAILEEGREPRALRSGETLLSGMRLETVGDARAALELTDGGSLRLDRGTRVALVDNRAMTLERGGLYFASDASEVVMAGQIAGTLEIRTDLGVIRDIGTQFEVRMSEELAVRVREGLIYLDSDGESHEAGAGVELRVSQSGELSRHVSANFGPSWDWILDVATPFTLEGHTLEAFLAWVSRETGWKTEFVDRQAGASASEVVLHGSIEGLRPDRALEAVLPTCGLKHRFEDGVLLIEAETRLSNTAE